MKLLMASSATSDHSHKIKRRKKNSSSTLLLDLLLLEIFPKLPVKSILRFKSVCKLFETVISSPAFIDLHLRQSLSSHVDDRLLILAGRKGHLTYAADLNSLHDQLPVRTLGFKGVIVGSCNGLVCMHSRDHSSLIIFNPSTVTYKNIKAEGHYYGFGYDNINDDYKVISLRFDSGEQEVTVYSLKLNTWSLVNKTPCAYTIQYMENATLVGNNLLYWNFYCANSCQNQIVCFDLQTNGWIEDIPFPDSTSENRIKSHAYDFLHLGVVDRCLSLSVRSADDASVIIWVMNEEHGAKQSWVKIATILIPQDIITPSLLHPTKLDFRYMDSLLFFADRSYKKGLTSEIFVNLLSKFWWYNTQPS